MFDGSFRERNKISLRGASKQNTNSKEALLLAKKQRLERQKEREKIQNVTTIQRVLRYAKYQRIIKSQKRSELFDYFALYQQTNTFHSNFYRTFIYASFWNREFIFEDYKTLQKILNICNEDFFAQQCDENGNQFLQQNYTLLSKVFYYLTDYVDLEVISTTSNLIEVLLLKTPRKEIHYLLLCKVVKNCSIFSILGKLLTKPEVDEVFSSEIERLFYNILHVIRTYLEDSDDFFHFNPNTLQEIKSIKELIPMEIISNIFVITDVFQLISQRNVTELVQLLSTPIYSYIVKLSYEMQSLSIILNTLQFAKISNSPSLILNLTSIFDPKLDSLLHRKMTIEDDWDDDSDDENNTPQDREEFLLIEQFNQLITPSQLNDLVSFVFQSKQMNENITLFCKLCYSVYEKYERLLDTPVINNLAFSTPFVTLIWRIAFSSILPSIQSNISSNLPLPSDMSAIVNLFCLTCSCILAAMDDEEFYSEKTFTTKEWQDICNVFKNIIVFQYEQRYFSRDPKSFNSVPLVRLLRNLYDFDCRTKTFGGENVTWVSDVLTRLYDKCSAEHKNEIIRDIPFLISLRKRFEIFQTLLQQLKDENHFYPHIQFRIRRSKIFKDSFRCFSSLASDDWFKKIRINFINPHGVEEAGIDGGGLFKEFITNLLELTFSTEFGLFKYSESKELYPNPDCYMSNYSLSEVYHFLGKLLAKGIMESILVHLYFARFFISKILGNKQFKINDLRYLDSQLYNNLMKLKNYPGNVEEDFCLTFSITIEESSTSRKKEIDLVPNGRNIAVNNENRYQYIHLVSKYWLQRQIQVQSNAFLSGFHSIIPSSWIRIFNEEELQLLISGIPDIDLEDLRENTNYTNGYDDDHETINFFWRALESFDPVQRMKFLKFVTGTVRSPLLGFANLSPKFGIHQAVSDTNRLPSASTCFNQLRLPNYSRYEILREKLLQAINADAGFDLS